MAIATRDDLYSRVVEGKGGIVSFGISGVAAGTNASTTSGFLNMRIHTNTIGTTYPSTLQSVSYNASTDAPLIFGFGGSVNYSNGLRICTPVLGWFYKLGTLNLAATGNQFTEDTGVGPFLRTRMGQASQPINLIPFIQYTTATATTAPTFYLRNATGPGNGYYNQSGTYTTGNVLWTSPAAATAQHSSMQLMLNIGDSAVQRITHIDVTAAGTAGAASIWGFEPIMGMMSDSQSIQHPIADIAHTAASLGFGTPATATSGTANAYLGVGYMQNSNMGTGQFYYTYVTNG